MLPPHPQPKKLSVPQPVGPQATHAVTAAALTGKSGKSSSSSEASSSSARAANCPQEPFWLHYRWWWDPQIPANNPTRDSLDSERSLLLLPPSRLDLGVPRRRRRRRSSSLPMERTGRVPETSEDLLQRLILLRRTVHRREGSLAAALAQSMALAMIGTAGAYPSWVLVHDGKQKIVLGAAWAIAQIDPPPDTPLLAPAGGTMLMAIGFCCLFSVASGSLALAMDFLGLRRCRSLAPFFHGLTATLVGCAAAMGSCLLALLRGRSASFPEEPPELEEAEADDNLFSASPGQSLFLAFLACALASIATGLSCVSPALVQPARSSWDLAMSSPTSTLAEEMRRRSTKVHWGGRLPAETSDEDDDDDEDRSVAPAEGQELELPELQKRSSLGMFWESSL